MEQSWKSFKNYRRLFSFRDGHKQKGLPPDFEVLVLDLNHFLSLFPKRFFFAKNPLLLLILRFPCWLKSTIWNGPARKMACLRNPLKSLFKESSEKERPYSNESFKTIGRTADSTSWTGSFLFWILVQFSQLQLRIFIQLGKQSCIAVVQFELVMIVWSSNFRLSFQSSRVTTFFDSFEAPQKILKLICLRN